MRHDISVIIPVYNGARFVCDALDSVCAQSLPPSEIIIADDCSTDNTKDIVTNYAKNSVIPITFFQMPRNTGSPFGPANVAAQRCNGNYIYILDVDDIVAPGAFETYMRMFEAGPAGELGMVTSDFSTFDDSTGAEIASSYFADKRSLMRKVLESNSMTGELLEKQEAIRLLASAWVLPFKGLITRTAWEQLGGCNLSYRYVGDCEFVWRLVAETNFRVRVIKQSLARVRMSIGSLSATKLTGSGEMIRLHRTMLKGVSDFDARAVIRGRLDKELFHFAHYAYKRRYYRKLFVAVWGLACLRFRGLFRRSNRSVVSEAVP
jgi:glycosyltransferase involved in cell wall biosynthesis